MKGDAIPSSSHIARYCRASTAPNGEIQATAFMLRPIDQGLSVNWLEFLERVERRRQIADLQRIFVNKMKKVAANAKFAVLNVGQIIDTVHQESEDSRQLTVIHDPQVNDQSHAEIRGLRLDDEAIAEILVQLVQETYPARA